MGRDWRMCQEFKYMKYFLDESDRWRRVEEKFQMLVNPKSLQLE